MLERLLKTWLLIFFVSFTISLKWFFNHVKANIIVKILMSSDNQQERPLLSTRFCGKLKYMSYYVLGLVDCEGSFCISLKRNARCLFGYQIVAEFSIYHHKSNRFILEEMVKFFHCGCVLNRANSNVCIYRVSNIRHLYEKVVPFFRKFKLVLQLRSFEIFESVVLGIRDGRHTKRDGFIDLVYVASCMSTFSDKKKSSMHSVIDSLKEID